ncbi:MAG TPA: tRNA (guanosine(37)-N1)-methyltransferase TrmD [Candidatus Paceibacterota bacterium]|nr:tRNA (guanosine(37)-N1)-methyltransferase TrmD [Candidatus Paceibacterota bacterium]HOL53930.1 tRNA (guanosine(37)-N1)-methyltransferase TrmD [Candidatus Paceibacterota bacterium]HON21578.1 tRNA (guanosine(37)-N1)-methyltransferase TrmD [Candidatus Paceibacterota bacterium]HOV88499.1 tRNA (guanosine(37)-N1)-methyltransferase TrmD [Candidatus Paceibacterota bacterium]HPP16820.1 tRNA (guanosine(37)-N1)-methyltransferase TrmD [Candidatus Paceibacterota bacterium]
MKTTTSKVKNKKTLIFDVISLFPEAFSYFNISILKRAQQRGIIEINIINPRDFTIDKHKKVDDKPYGGGPGMVMKIEPIWKAVQFSRSKSKTQKSKIILFSPRGKKFDQKMARRLAKYNQLILICGHYEGVDERVAKYIADEEISVGDYILSGGEIPAMIVVDAVSRLIPGVLGKYESLEDIKGSYPTYTRPEIFYPHPKNKKIVWRVPKILLSGHHQKIAAWQKRKNDV